VAKSRETRVLYRKRAFAEETWLKLEELASRGARARSACKIASSVPGLVFCATSNPADTAQSTTAIGMNPSALLTWLKLLLRSVWTGFGFALRVFQISEFRGHSAVDCRSLAAILETGEVGAIAPGIWSAEPLPSC
jgi:hypothetical protein